MSRRSNLAEDPVGCEAEGAGAQWAQCLAPHSSVGALPPVSPGAGRQNCVDLLILSRMGSRCFGRICEGKKREWREVKVFESVQNQRWAQSTYWQSEKQLPPTAFLRCLVERSLRDLFLEMARGSLPAVFGSRISRVNCVLMNEESQSTHSSLRK